MSDHAPAVRFVPGFVGVPGDRTFLLEIDDTGGRVWYLLEKVQVAAFAEQCALLLADLGLSGAGKDIDPGPLSEPDDIEFRVGRIGIDYHEERDLIEITLEPSAEDAMAVVHAVTPAQLDAAVRLGAAAVASGRPKCPRCGLAIDPDGHVCPTTNGDLRDHRP